MARYRKKPVEIEAVQFREMSRTQRKHGVSVERNEDEVSRFMGKPVRTRFIPEEGNPEGRVVLEIETLEGVMQASVGDYIIRGVQGELYPCKPDIFAATYELAE
ncbi:hypothetical protein FIU88_08265 [Halomonas sp. THAF12]|uniref:hypothetical protein n=1 Tax=Halomonas sp. THAF12 TaxID=2587849 RepID=UPI0012680BDC|nr:hypothetical protein [Halomonas sp. THAF12]QFT84968.1 hypothetical protein FIU88_08265 [Halomonas sp. THAF12]